MAEIKQPTRHKSGNSKSASPSGSSLKAGSRAADVIYARSRLLNSPEMRERMDALASVHHDAHAAGHAYGDFARYEQQLHELDALTDGLFDWRKLDDLAEQWDTVSTYLDDHQDWAGVFCSVGFSDPTGFELRLYEDGQTEMVVVDDRRHAGKGPHHRDLDTLDRAVLSLRHRLRSGYVSMSDETAADEWNPDWGLGPEKTDLPKLIKRDRQKLRQLVGSL